MLEGYQAFYKEFLPWLICSSAFMLQSPHQNQFQEAFLCPRNGRLTGEVSDLAFERSMISILHALLTKALGVMVLYYVRGFAAFFQQNAPSPLGPCMWSRWTTSPVDDKPRGFRTCAQQTHFLVWSLEAMASGIVAKTNRFCRAPAIALQWTICGPRTVAPKWIAHQLLRSHLGLLSCPEAQGTDEACYHSADLF